MHIDEPIENNTNDGADGNEKCQSVGLTGLLPHVLTMANCRNFREFEYFFLSLGFLSSCIRASLNMHLLCLLHFSVCVFFVV